MRVHPKVTIGRSTEFWEELVRALQKNFAPAEFQNPDEHLCSINLRDDLKVDVRIHKPRTVYKEMSIALEFESKKSRRRKPNPSPLAEIVAVAGNQIRRRRRNPKTMLSFFRHNSGQIPANSVSLGSDFDLSRSTEVCRSTAFEATKWEIVEMLASRLPWMVPRFFLVRIPCVGLSYQSRGFNEAGPESVHDQERGRGYGRGVGRGNYKRNLRCYERGRAGHFAYECPELKEREEELGFTQVREDGPALL
ncbi:hypothetical protein E3N88_13052 [Mikania micrantha]|uniref:CCHC-type domain-containing protein n=1 Tax=Mikania micrantha TaxID=192012 RepID=A0A5N6P7N7_9ASTR|nr:hypothetical protein E3N88_13052 [Mikania micrantha]